MPRIYSSVNDPLDFCQRCFPSEKTAISRYANLGDGPDNRGNCFEWDADHPPYSDTDYRCEKCGRLLTNKDNWKARFPYITGKVIPNKEPERED